MIKREIRAVLILGRSDNLEVGDIVVDDEAMPARGGEKAVDFLVSRRSPGDGRLTDQQPKSFLSIESAEKVDIIAEKFVVV